MKVFHDDKDLNPPAGFNDNEAHFWRASMLGAISAYIDPATWERVYAKITAGFEADRKQKEALRCA